MSNRMSVYYIDVDEVLTYDPTLCYFLFSSDYEQLWVVPNPDTNPSGTTIYQYYLSKGLLISINPSNDVILEVGVPPDSSATAPAVVTIQKLSENFTFAGISLFLKNESVVLGSGGFGVADILDTDPVDSNYMSVDFNGIYETNSGETTTIKQVGLITGTVDAAHSFTTAGSTVAVTVSPQPMPCLLFYAYYEPPTSE